ncbi:ABC transporter permease [Amorphus orientalis]|uniref:Spermidine/putrescine transport system permease protein n=1 Tax=Amorphus orientalis TaxID=649198 RepID=A0AAE4AQI6_9HYPH|nr:ABC transporter permease [Amorphus orientalis]MDQ0314126.1 putative spermidine/putrescine transport system permease protein [Amorphus orientalis]
MKVSRPGPVMIALAALVAVFLLMPLLAVVPVSFTPKRYLSIPEEAWSLRHYRNLIEDPAWLDSILISFRVGLLASALATGLGLCFTLGIWLLRPAWSRLLMGIAILPMVAPPVVSALTLYFFLNWLSQIYGPIGYDTWIGVAIAHAVMISPYAVVVLTVALSQVDRRIDLAAKSMGASLSRRIFQVILPNIRFGILGAFFLCFVLSWDEIGVTLFITSVDAITLPRRMWMGLRDNVDPTIAAISVILIAIVTLVILARTAWQLTRRKANS